MTRDRAALVFRQAFFDDPAARAAYLALMRAVFELDVAQRDAMFGIDSTCRPFAVFDPEGSCVASVEVLALPLVIEGARCPAMAVRSVAVHEDWRGHGLFRTLMEEALAWCDKISAGPVLLYTEESMLYERFGFRDVPQHKVVGAAPPVSPGFEVRRLSLGLPDNVTLITRLLTDRAPVSDHVAVTGAGILFLTQVAGDENLSLDYAVSLDALIVSRQHNALLTLVDIVAPRIPPLPALLAVLGWAPRRIEILFPPDKLGWSGVPLRDDTGLMIRGAWPAAFDRPFMLPPTAEF